MAKRNSNAAGGSRVPAVGYIRMSTERQEHSPERQRAEIQHLADRDGYCIVKWYEDHGLTGTESANRPEFQRLPQDAERGRFEAILLHEQSRFSREDIFDVMLHWRLLRQAGVDIVTCQRGRLRFDDLGGIITAIIDQHSAREESMKLAYRVVSGLRLRASQGKRIGGTVFAYDRELTDEQGKFIRRVHFRERFRKPPTWSSRLVPSHDMAAVEGLQWGFEAVRQGHSVFHVCRGLNERGLTTTFGNRFTHSSTLGLLTNPTYAGILQAGTESRGKFCRFDADGLIVVENAHEPLVTPADFEEVQGILARRKRHHERSQPGTYLLSGAITCVHCGNRVFGVPRKGRGKERPQAFYQCGPDRTKPGYDPNCPRPAVRVERLEQFVLDAIREHLLETGAAERVKAAIIRAKSRMTVEVSQDEKRLRKIRQKIQRGTENLALAAREDFAAISTLLVKWHEEEAELADRVTRRQCELEPLPEALEVIAKYGAICRQLKLANRVKLAHAVRQTVASNTIGTREAKTGGITHRELFGELRLHKALHNGKPILIPDTAIGYRNVWREIGMLVRESDHPLHLADFAKHIGTKDLSRAAHHVRRAEKAGLMRKIGHQGGWVAAE